MNRTGGHHLHVLIINRSVVLIIKPMLFSMVINQRVEALVYALILRQNLGVPWPKLFGHPYIQPLIPYQKNTI